MDSSNITTTTTTSNSTTNYQEIPLSSFRSFSHPPPPASSPPSPSFFDPLPSYLPTFPHEPPSSSSSSQPPPPPPPASSSKKRSRASRRAPTTVLTTDTSNFRAMVQEFTGFPALPFAAPRPPRFDQLSASSSSPYFLSRPFAHRLPSPSSLVGAIAAAATAADAAAYPFANAASMVGIQNQNNNILAPPPQFGDQLKGFGSNSEGIQQQQQQISAPVGHGGSLSSWADDQHDHQDPDQFQQLEKRLKASGDGGAVEPWIRSSD